MIGNNGYIGRAPGDSTSTVLRQVYQPTGIQTTFSFPAGYDNQYFDVYLNGARQVRGIDYQAGDGSTFRFTTYVQPGDIVEAVTFKAFNAAQATIGVSSNGATIGEAQVLNFVGSATTFSQQGSTINVEVDGSSGGVGTAIRYPSNTRSPFSYIDATVNVTESIGLTTANAGESYSYVVVQEPRIVVSTGATITVGLGKTLVTDLYQLGDL
jgi:hypothetical protein